MSTADATEAELTMVTKTIILLAVWRQLETPNEIRYFSPDSSKGMAVLHLPQLLILTGTPESLNPLDYAIVVVYLIQPTN